MTDQEFFDRVARRTGLPPARVRALIEATVRTLAETLTREEVKDAELQLPRSVRDVLHEVHRHPHRRSGLPYSAEDFVQLVSRRADIPLDQVRPHILVVVGTLHDALTEGEWSDIVEQLVPSMQELMLEAVGAA